MQFNVSGTTLQTVSIDLQAGETVYSQRDVMAWMTDNVQMNTTIGGGLFKAIARSFSGGGMFVIEYTAQGPARIAFQQRLGAGLFGGEGLFLATVTGPGRVWLQSMPIMNLAEEIGKFLPQREVREAAGGGIVGGVIGSILKGE